MLADRVRIEGDRPELAFGLCLDIVVFRRQQGLDAKTPPLFGGEAEPLVVQRVA